MLEGKALVKETDMSPKMQIHAMAAASHALDLYDVSDCISVAAHIKKVPLFHLSFYFFFFFIFSSPIIFFFYLKARFCSMGCMCYFVLIISLWCLIFQEFDSVYGNGWQCVVGSNFGCYFTHSSGTFIYFALETLNFLIFKGSSSWFMLCTIWDRIQGLVMRERMVFDSSSDYGSMQ